MVKPLVRLTALALLAALSKPTGAAAAPLDLELVLAVDSSGSIDEEEAELQRRGYANAFLSRRVLDAIRSGYGQAIAVLYLEWAAEGCETIAVDWTRIHDLASAKRFAAAILEAPRLDCSGGNAIGDAIDYAATLLRTNRYRGSRLVIDVSGDGPNTLGRPVTPARDAAVLAGITINGLAIINPGRTYPGPGGMPLDAYYRRAVIGGAGAFVMVAKGDATFTDAVRNKLVREIAGRDAPAPFAGLSAPAPVR